MSLGVEYSMEFDCEELLGYEKVLLWKIIEKEDLEREYLV